MATFNNVNVVKLIQFARFVVFESDGEENLL